MLELMNIYKIEGKKLIVLYECAGEVTLGPRCGRDDWTAGSRHRAGEEEGGREMGNGKPLELMICH